MSQQRIHEPRFERRLDERCQDCETNGYLSNAGSPLKDAPTWLCSNCGGSGRVRLFTWADVRADIETVLARLRKPGARLVSAAETLDPYLIRKKG